MRLENLFITDVKVVHSYNPTVQIPRLMDEPLYTEDWDGCAVMVDAKVKEELMQAKRFRTRDGRVVSIGASEAVQEILRIPFEVFDDMNEEAEKNWRARKRLQKKVEGLTLEIAIARSAIVELAKPGYMKLWETLKAWKDLL